MLALSQRYFNELTYTCIAKSISTDQSLLPLSVKESVNLAAMARFVTLPGAVVLP